MKTLVSLTHSLVIFVFFLSLGGTATAKEVDSFCKVPRRSVNTLKEPDDHRRLYKSAVAHCGGGRSMTVGGYHGAVVFKSIEFYSQSEWRGGIGATVIYSCRMAADFKWEDNKSVMDESTAEYFCASLVDNTGLILPELAEEED